MAETQVLEKRKRRTQAERSAATREVLLDATIRCLFEHGYSRTTTLLVAEVAGVSRGAMLHQFPTKIDLMAFVMEEVFEQEVALYGELLKGIDDPRERLIAYPAAVWKVMSRPGGVAVLEIMQGSRSDADAGPTLNAVRERIEQSAIDRLGKEFPKGVSTALLQLIVGTARGLSITRLISPENDSSADAIELLQRFLRAGIDAHVLTSKPPTR